VGRADEWETAAMPDLYHHQRSYRGADLVSRLGAVPVTLCGAGALGSLLADNLARQGIRRWKVIDRDRVEEHNAGSQLYGQAEVGAWKVEALRNRLFRAVGVEIEPIAKELNDRNARSLLKGSGLVIDAFDNSAARRSVQEHCRASAIPCLHIGLNADYAEVIWDRDYRVPSDVAGDLCDYPLARNLVLLAVAVASESLLRYVQDGRQDAWSVTLGDFAVRPLETVSGNPSIGGRDRATGS
jgi:molybdopterin/thiamine biosynthesis adenylyltransferase